MNWPQTHSPKGKSVLALARGLAVLSCFSAKAHHLVMEDLAARSLMTMPEVRRVVHTLKQLGFLHHDQATDSYGLGTAALTFAGGNIGNHQLREFVAPLMQELAESTEVSVALGVRQHLSMVCIEARRSRALISLDMGVGMHLPLVSSAMGRAYLATCTDDERYRLLEAIGESQLDLLPEVVLAIDRSLATYELLGASCCFGEWHSDVNGIAVGFHPGHGLPAMAINCGAPAVQASGEYLLNEVRPRLLHLVRRIHDEFGQIPREWVCPKQRPARAALHAALS